MNDRGKLPKLPTAVSRRKLLLAATGGLLLAGCPNSDNAPDSPSGTPASPKNADTGAFKDLDPWVLTTTDPNANRGNHGVYLSNGLVGATFGENGGAGKDARLFVAGQYDKSETIRPFDNVHAINLPPIKSGDKYEQTLDLKRGVLTTKMGAVTVTTIVTGRFVAGNVVGAPKTAELLATHNDYAWSVDAESRTEGDGSWTILASADDPSARYPYPSPSMKELLTGHESDWAKIWSVADIEIDGDPEAQQLVRKLLFDLVQSVGADSEFSVAPEGLSGEFYKGHIFWDADVWVFPALLALHPERAKSLLNYRYRTLAKAKANAAVRKLPGADYAWESAATGKETAPGGFSAGRHVTAGVGWAHGLYYRAVQDKAWLSKFGWPVLSAVADHLSARAKKTANGYSIGPVNGPDEMEPGVTDNAYTNAMTKAALHAAIDAAKTLGKLSPPLWADVAEKLTVPFDAARGIYLKNADDKGKKTKQADGELLLWPARLPMDNKTAAATFDFHRARPIENGPAMTAAMHALIAARLGRASDAEKAFRASYRPFVRGPFLLFSEKRSLDRCVFLTGAAGVLQSVIYGFGGVDFDHWDQIASAPIALPPTWKKLTLRGVARAGKRYTITVTPQKRTISPV